MCNGDVLALLERCYRTTDRYDKEQTSPLALLEAWWLSASLSKRAALSQRSFDNASLAVTMAQGIKTSLLCVHGPTVLTNPEPCSADFLSACIARS